MMAADDNLAAANAAAAAVQNANASASAQVAAAQIAAAAQLGSTDISGRYQQNIAGMNIGAQMRQLAAQMAADRELEQMRQRAADINSQRQIDLAREQIGADISKLSMSLQAQYADMAEKYGIQRAQLAFDQQVQQAKEFGSPRDWVSAAYFYRNAQNPSPTGSLNYQVQSRPNYATDPNFGTNVPSSFSGIGAGKGGYPTGQPVATAYSNTSPGGYGDALASFQQYAQSLPSYDNPGAQGTYMGIPVGQSSPFLRTQGAAGGSFLTAREPSGPTPGGLPPGTIRTTPSPAGRGRLSYSVMGADGYWHIFEDQGAAQAYASAQGGSPQASSAAPRQEAAPGPFQAEARPPVQDPSTLPQSPDTGFTGGMVQQPPAASQPPPAPRGTAQAPAPLRAPTPSQQSAARAAAVPAPGVSTPPANVSAVEANRSGALQAAPITPPETFPSRAMSQPLFSGPPPVSRQAGSSTLNPNIPVPPPPGSTYTSPSGDRVMAPNPDGSGDHVEMYFDPADSQWHQVTPGNMGPGRTMPYGPGIPGYNQTGALPFDPVAALSQPQAAAAPVEKPYNPMDYISKDDQWGQWIGADPTRAATMWRPTPQTPYIPPWNGITEAPNPATLNNPGPGREYTPGGYGAPAGTIFPTLRMTGEPSPDNPPQPGMTWNPLTRTWEYPTGPSFTVGGRAEGGSAVNSMVVGEAGPEVLNFTKSGANISPMGPKPDLPGTPQYNMQPQGQMALTAPANKAAQMVMPQPMQLPVTNIPLPPWLQGLVKGAADGMTMTNEGRPSPLTSPIGTGANTGGGTTPGDITTMPNPYTQTQTRPAAPTGQEAAPQPFGYFDANMRYNVGPAPTSTGTFYGWTPEALANMPWLQALSKNAVMPQFQAYGGPLNLNQMPGANGQFPGIPDVPAPHQIAPQAWQAMSPTEQSMALAYYQALGFEPETVMRNIAMSTPGTTRSDRTFWRT